MKKEITSAFMLLVMLLMSFVVSAQMKIGTNPTQIVSGSKLQIDGDNTTTAPAKLIVTGTGNVGIGTAAPAASALLDISAADKGMLMPRVSLTAANVAGPVTNPATSLMVYNTATAGTAPNNVTPGYYYWDGAKWVQLLTTIPNNNWNLLGNTGTNASTNFVGTTDNTDLVTRTNNTEKMRVTTAGNVGVGTATPDASALLDLGATNKGMLMPRVSLTAANVAGPVTNPATSLMVYNTATAGTEPNNVTPGYYYWDGAKWVQLLTTIPNNNWNLLGNAGTNASTNFVGTTDNIDLVTRTNNTEKMRVTAAGNVGVGTAMPDASALLDLGATNKGMLMPRVSLTAANVAGPVTNPATSLMVYNTATAGTAPDNVTPGYYYWDGAKWVQLLTTIPNSNWNLLGNAGTNASTNFIGTTDNIDFVTRTNSAERMRVTAAGNVGIGTVTPGETLSVSNPNTGIGIPVGIFQPNLAANSGTYIKFGKVSAVNDAADIAFNYQGAGSLNNYLSLGFSGNPISNMVLKADGKVGVGTATPAQKLHVEGAARITGNAGTPINVVGRDANGDVANLTLGTGLSITAGTLNATTSWNLLGNTGTDASTNFVGTADNIDFVTRTSNAERMRVTAAGNVGIGTTTPNAPLQFSNGIANRKIVLYELANNDNQYFGLGINGNMFRYQTAATTADHVFYAGIDKDYSSELMRITGTGNVGIGTSTPQGRFNVLGTPGGQLDLMQIGLNNCGLFCSQGNGRSLVLYNANGTLSATSTFGSIHFVPSADPNQPEGVSIVSIDRDPANNSGGLDFRTRNITTSAMNSRLTIRNGGNIGIGTATPTSLLSVNGGADKTDGPNWAVFSDKRLKKDIHPFTDGLQQILQIKPVFFKYNGKGGIDPSKKEQIGIIAQEMQQIAPYAITETERKIDDSGKGALQFDHSEAVTYMLVNAVKDQQGQIEKQKTENTELKKQLAAQQETLSSLLKEVASLKESISTKK